MNSQSHVATNIDRNIAIHDRIAHKYEKMHGEIFNSIEQLRLRQLLERALSEVRTGRPIPSALDMGCGSGNLTGHLLEIGAEVTAADVSAGFLHLVDKRYFGRAMKTHQLNGRDMSELADESFDLVATYSVLHHIPEYLGACAEMARVCRRGGVVVVDHEASPNVWQADPLLEQFRREATPFDWGKYTKAANYLHRLWRLFDPKHSNEGDIHVWPDDHIDWDQITEVMTEGGLKPVLKEDYLLFRKLYRQEVYDRYKARCADMRVMIFRRET